MPNLFDNPMKKKKSLLIIGSNFGLNHCIAAIKSKKFERISICSPNINNKKKFKSVVKYKNFKIALDQNNFDMISVAATPKVQNDILNYIFKKNIFPKLLFLEKPLLNSSVRLINKFPKKILILTNFIFSFNDEWILYKKKINKLKKRLKFFEYLWLFKQAYFINKKKTWKINKKLGGGLTNYYLPHAIFNIFNIFEKAKFKRISKKIFFNKNLIYLELIFCLNKNNSKLIISNKSDENRHILKTNFEKNNLLLENKTKKWLSNFKIFMNNKEVIKKKNKIIRYDSRINALASIYSNLNYYFSNNYIVKNKSLTYKTFKLIEHINNRLK